MRVTGAREGQVTNECWISGITISTGLPPTYSREVAVFSLVIIAALFGFVPITAAVTSTAGLGAALIITGFGLVITGYRRTA